MNIYSLVFITCLLIRELIHEVITGSILSDRATAIYLSIPMDNCVLLHFYMLRNCFNKDKCQLRTLILVCYTKNNENKDFL